MVGTLGSYLADTERRYIEQALDRNCGRIADTATELGISRKNLWEKMRKLGIQGQAGESGASAYPGVERQVTGTFPTDTG